MPPVPADDESLGANWTTTGDHRVEQHVRSPDGLVLARSRGTTQWDVTLPGVLNAQSAAEAARIVAGGTLSVDPVARSLAENPELLSRNYPDAPPLQFYAAGVGEPTFMVVLVDRERALDDPKRFTPVRGMGEVAVLTEVGLAPDTQRQQELLLLACILDAGPGRGHGVGLRAHEHLAPLARELIRRWREWSGDDDVPWDRRSATLLPVLLSPGRRIGHDPATAEACVLLMRFAYERLSRFDVVLADVTGGRLPTCPPSHRVRVAFR